MDNPNPLRRVQLTSPPASGANFARKIYFPAYPTLHSCMVAFIVSQNEI
jgi:hypothetical protein